MDSGAHPVYEFCGYRLHPRRRLLERTGGERIALTSAAFSVLVYLVEHAGELVPRAALIEAVWPNTVVEDNNVTKAVSVLRHVIGAELIVTVPRRGYQFVADVQRIESAPAILVPVAAAENPAPAFRAVNDPGPALRAVRAAPPSAPARTMLLRALVALALAATLLAIGVAAL